MPERLIAIIIFKQVDEEEAIKWADVPKIKALVRPELNSIRLENTQLIDSALAQFQKHDENSPEIILQTGIELAFVRRRGGAKFN